MAKKKPWRDGRERTRAGYPAYPLNLSDDVWLYEDRFGISIYQKARLANGQSAGIVGVAIPWSVAARAVDNHRKAKRRRPSPAQGK